MTFYVDACALVYFQFHPRSVCRSVGRSVDPGTTSRHFGAETKNHDIRLFHQLLLYYYIASSVYYNKSIKKFVPNKKVNVYITASFITR